MNIYVKYLVETSTGTTYTANPGLISAKIISKEPKIEDIIDILNDEEEISTSPATKPEPEIFPEIKSSSSASLKTYLSFFVLIYVK